MALKSFTIKIGADTKDFNKELKNADKVIKSTVKEGKALKEALKLDYTTGKFEATQRTYQHALELTNQKAEALREQLKYLEENGGIDTDSYYDIQTQLAKTEIQAKDFKKTIEELNNIKLDTLSKNIQDVGNKITSVGKVTSVFSAAAAGVLAGSYSLASSARETGDEIATLATQYDMSAESIQKWNYIALQTDVSSETLYKSMTKARDAVGTLMAGETNSATEAISTILGGASLSTDSEEAFNQIINALANITDNTQQAYYTNEIFGQNLATDILPLIKSGAGVIAELSDEFESVGYLTNDEIQTLSDLDNQMNKVETHLSNAKTQLGAALTPILEIVADLLEDKIVPATQKLVSWFNNLSSSQQKLITYILAFVAVLGPLLLIIGKITTGVGSLIKSCGNLKTTLTELSNRPIILILGIIIGLLATLYATNEEFRESVNSLFKILQPIFSLVGTFTSGALKYLINSLSDILNLLAPIASFMVNDITLGIYTVMTALIPVVYVLEFIIKLLQTIVAVAKDVFTFKWGSISSDVKGIWSDWAANDFAKSSLNGVVDSVKDLFGGSGSTYDYTTYDTSSATSYSTDYSTNSNDTYNITIQSSSDASASEIAEEVIKQIVTKKQASGR